MSQQFSLWTPRGPLSISQEARSLRGSVQRPGHSIRRGAGRPQASPCTHACGPTRTHGATGRGPVTCMWTNTDIRATPGARAQEHSPACPCIAARGEPRLPAACLPEGNCALQADGLLLPPAPAAADGESGLCNLPFSGLCFLTCHGNTGSQSWGQDGDHKGVPSPCSPFPDENHTWPR